MKIVLAVALQTKISFYKQFTRFLGSIPKCLQFLLNWKKHTIKRLNSFGGFANVRGTHHMFKSAIESLYSFSDVGVRAKALCETIRRGCWTSTECALSLALAISYMN